VSGHVSLEIHDLKQSGMRVTVDLDAQPHTAPANHRAIPCRDYRTTKLKIGHALIVPAPNAVQGLALRLVQHLALPVVRVCATGNEVILARKMDERHLGLHPAGGKVGGGEFGSSGLEGLEGIEEHFLWLALENRALFIHSPSEDIEPVTMTGMGNGVVIKQFQTP
jgi:hypothetical protein